MIKAGSIVTFANPAPEEDGSYECVFRVLELRGTRALVERVWCKDIIKPSFVYFLSDLRLSFAEHPDIKVPNFVDFSVWKDTSWHNDITASVEQKISEEYSIKVWIYDSKAWKESEPLLNLFHVCVIHNLEGWTTEGYSLDTEEEVLAKVQEIKADVDSFILKMGWC